MEPPLPEGCPKNARIFTYDPVGHGHLADAFGNNPSPCADYYIHLPAIAGDKTMPRGPNAVEDVHSHGARFHALAEFHWGGWAAVSGMTWLEKGKEFRKRMIDKGYDPTRDAWSVNELPSTTKSDPTVRQHVRDVVKGLYTGPDGAPANGGLIYVIGVGSEMVNYSVYKPALEDWLVDQAFWKDMSQYVRWWGQEVYTDPISVCVGSASPGQRAAHINDFVMHPAKLAAAGPPAAGAARAFFNESYVPIMNGAWHAEAYNTEATSLDTMKHHVSTQIYAARVWSNDHVYPDWRTGIAWNNALNGASQADVDELALRIANAIRYGYADDGGGASKACSPSGAYTWCACSVGSAGFNDGWNAFETW